MRRRVSGCTAPNTASSASVHLSKIVVHSSFSRQSSWSNSNAAPATLTTISVTGPSLPTPVSLRRQPLAVNASSTMQPVAYASSGSVSGTRRSVCQRTSLRNVGSCRSTRCTVPSLLAGRSLSRSGWAPAGSGASIAEYARQAFSATRNASYGGHSHQSLDSVAMRRGASFRCTQTASFSHVLRSPKLSGRRSRELTTVLSSVDIEVTHTSRRAGSRSSAFEYLPAHQPAQLSSIGIGPVAIEPPQFKSLFSPAPVSSTFDKFPHHEDSQKQFGQVPTDRSALPERSDVPQSDSDLIVLKSPMQSPPQYDQHNKDATAISPPPAIEFTPSQPTTLDGKQTEASDSQSAVLSPPRPIEFSQTQPMSEDILTPLRPLDLLTSSPMQLDLSSPPKPIGSLLSQPMSLGLFSPPKPIEFSPSQPMSVNLSTPPQPIGFSDVQPMSLHLLSPPRPIEFGQMQGLSLQVEARPSEVPQLASPMRPVDLFSSTGTRSLLQSPKSPERPGKPESPLVEINAFSPPPGANTQHGPLIQVNSAVPLQLQLLLSPPKAIDFQPQQTSPPGSGATTGSAASGPLSPVSAVLSPQLKQEDVLSSSVTSSSQISPLQHLPSWTKAPTDTKTGKPPAAFLMTPPTPVIVEPQPRRPTVTSANFAERRPSKKRSDGAIASSDTSTSQSTSR